MQGAKFKAFSEWIMTAKKLNIVITIVVKLSLEYTCT